MQSIPPSHMAHPPPPGPAPSMAPGSTSAPLSHGLPSLSGAVHTGFPTTYASTSAAPHGYGTQYHPPGPPPAHHLHGAPGYAQHAPMPSMASESSYYGTSGIRTQPVQPMPLTSSLGSAGESGPPPAALGPSSTSPYFANSQPKLLGGESGAEYRAPSAIASASRGLSRLGIPSGSPPGLHRRYPDSIHSMQGLGGGELNGQSLNRTTLYPSRPPLMNGNSNSYLDSTKMHGHGQPQTNGALDDENNHSGPSSSSNKERQQGPSDFVRKLYRLLDPAEGNQASIAWSPAGDSFMVKDMNSFTSVVLPQTFRHSNFSSFVRQLNKYGFAKVKSGEDKPSNSRENTWEFKHPQFFAGGAHELEHIKRKITSNRKPGANQGDDGADNGDSPNYDFDGQNDSSSAASVQALHSQVNTLQRVNDRLLDQVNLMSEEVKALRNEMRIMRSREGAKDAWLPELLAFVVGSARDIYSSPDQGTAAYSAANRMIASYNRLQHRLGSESRIDLEQCLLAMSRDGSSTTSTTTPAGPGNLESEAVNDAFAQPGLAHSTLTSINSSFPWMSMENGTSKGPNSREGKPPPTTDGSRSNEDDAERSKVPKSEAPGLTVEIPHDLPDPGADQQLDMTDSDGHSVPVVMEPDTPSGTEQTTTNNAKGLVRNTKREKLRRSKIHPSWMFPPRVLVVEDDVVTQTISTKFLQMVGCDTDVAGDAETALSKINTGETYDLILMDIHLPQISGIGATSIIRKSDLATPIISMTHNPLPDDIKSFFSHGMSDILPKPFTKQGLFVMLEKHLDHLKAIRQISSDISRSVGNPPLSDQGVQDALAVGAAGLHQGLTPFTDGDATQGLYNPLSGMGCSDEMYLSMLQSYAATGAVTVNQFEPSPQFTGNPGFSFTMTTTDAFLQNAPAYGGEAADTGRIIDTESLKRNLDVIDDHRPKRQKTMQQAIMTESH